MWKALAILALVSCYSPDPYGVCTIQCVIDPLTGDRGPCPAGLSCMPNGLCGTATDGCTDGVVDGGLDTKPVDPELDASPRCGRALADTIAEYPVDGDDAQQALTDTTGNHPAPVKDGTVASLVAVTASTTDCGVALDLAGERNAEIPDSAAFDLMTGSFDLWVRPPALSQVSRVIVARDNPGNNPGDVALFHHHSTQRGHVFVLRLQSGGSTAGDGTYRCSHVPIVPGTWYHVAVSFGSPGAELRIDDVVQAGADTVVVNTETWECGTSAAGQELTDGIDGPDTKPWTIGAGIIFANGSATRQYYTGGANDHFRISGVRYP